MSRRHTAARRIQDLYAQVPAVDCRGDCATTCTSFPIPRIEKRLIRRATGIDLGPKHRDPRTTTCPLLDQAGRCTGYDVRPLICRIWGTSQLYPCRFGCRPDGELLTMAETYRLLSEAYIIGGQVTIARMTAAMADLPADTVARMTPIFAAFINGEITFEQADAQVAQLRQRTA